MPVEERCGEDCAKWVNRAPWNRYTGEEYADGELPDEVSADKIEPSDSVSPGGVVLIETRHRAPREFYIKKSDADKHGYTRGCG